MCSQMPYAVLAYLKTVYTNKLERGVKSLESDYDSKRVQATQEKENHLRMFRPNLENP